MTALMTTLIIIHVIISVALIVVVLLQQSKQQNISGAIMGGNSDTFFGKNKGRTVDAILKKITSVLAALFIVSSVSLALVSIEQSKPPVEQTEETGDASTENNGEAADNGEATDGNDAADVTDNADTNADTQGETAPTPAE